MLVSNHDFFSVRRLRLAAAVGPKRPVTDAFVRSDQFGYRSMAGGKFASLDQHDPALLAYRHVMLRCLRWGNSEQSGTGAQSHTRGGRYRRAFGGELFTW